MDSDAINFDYAQIGGVRLHYAMAGTGDRLVLLLHGFPEFWYSWRHQLAGLSDRYTLVAPDLRGYHWSDKPSPVADYVLDNLVDDCLGLISHFGREQAAVVGHDWGAFIAWEMAARHPEAVWKLCSMQVPPIPVAQQNFSFRQALASLYMVFFQIPRLPEWLLSRNDFALTERFVRRAAADPDFISAEEMARYRESWREPGALTAAVNYYRANFFPNLARPRRPIRIKVPTLFIYGEKEKAILPETIRGVREVIDAEYSEIRIPDAGHWVQQEVPDIVNDSLREFLAA